MTTMADHCFRLYVAGGSANSQLAREHLETICRERLAGRCRIEVIDVMRHPERALADGILVTPTLVRIEPAPQVRVIGNLTPRTKVEAALGLEAKSL